MILKPISDELFRDLCTGHTPSYDIEWFGTDSKGQIAVFTTAGFGALPRDVLRSRNALNDVRAIIGALPKIGHATWVRSPPPRPDDFTSFAEIGLFAYDWDCRSAQPARLPYQLQCTPSCPIHVSSLPTSVVEWIGSFAFPLLTFGHVEQILVESYFDELVYPA